jgi:chemotaxis signal transduction protein
VAPRVLFTNDVNGSATDVQRALEFRVGRPQLAIRLDQVARVIELPCVALPRTNPLVRGVGFEDARTIVFVSLTRDAVAANGAVVRAVLLQTSGRVGWALCIDEVLDLITVTQLATPDRDHKLPRWVRKARTTDARMIGWIDADVLVRELAGQEAP